MIQLTSTALADFIVSDDAEKRRVLQKYKYPRGTIIGFYTAARTAVRRLHAHVITPQEALAQASELERRARIAHKAQTKQRAENNARAIREYVAMTGAELAPALAVPPDLVLRRGTVSVRASVDLRLQLRRSDSLVRLHLNAREIEPAKISVITQCVLLTAQLTGMTIRGGQVALYDVHRGCVHRGGTIRSRMTSIIYAAMENIEAMWSTITPPRARPAR